MNIGDEVAELALNYGADDIDGTVRQESIMHLAGADSSLNYDTYQMAKLVEDAGFTPVSATRPIRALLLSMSSHQSAQGD